MLRFPAALLLVLCSPLLAGTPLRLERFEGPAPEFRSPEQPADSETRTGPRSAASGQALQACLEHDFPGEITEVDVREKSVLIRGRAPRDAVDLALADIPIDLLLDDPARFDLRIALKPDPDGGFRIEVPRERLRSGRRHDRLLSRWQLVALKNGRIKPLSHARHADQVACRSPQLAPATPRSKKGLGGWSIGQLPDEIRDLGISAVTINVMIHSLVAAEAGPHTEAFEWQGRSYHADMRAIESLDRTLLAAAQQDLMVSAILLVANPARDGSQIVQTLGHPDAVRDGTFAMPDVTSEEGISLYGAILNLMAERWSRPDGKHGRIHHWIVHNEIDAGWVWTNAGTKTALEYMDLYQRSMRLVDLIARQYDPNSRAFITLTHHWASPGAARWYGSRNMLELLNRFCRAEGDFPWGVAYHPYPQDLNNPRTWEDGQATFTFDSEKITPRNIEVLDAYMHLPEMRHRGALRPVHLSENGFNSRDYSEQSLADQAAGMAYAWKKIAPLESIGMWHYHNWIDNRGEGGLRIGLRKFPDDADDPLGKKPIWPLYQALGTPQEDLVAKPYLKILGLDSWDQALHPVPIPGK